MVLGSFTAIACGLVVAADPAAAPPAATAAAQPAPAASLPDFKRWIIAGDFSADGSLLLTAGGESLLYRPGDVVLWTASDGKRAADMAGHPTAVWAAKISKDMKLAATAGYDGLVKLWDVAGKSLKHDLKKHKGWVRSLAFSPDGSKLATAGEDGTVVIWNTADGKEVKTVAAHAGPVTAVAFSPDGATIATGGGDKLVKLWNAADGAEKGKLEGHGDAIWAVAYSPDGSKLASCGADRSVKLWTTSDSKEYATLAGHKDWATSLAFTADGSRLASGCLDGTVKLWDVAAKAEQIGPEAVKSSVWTVAFTPDGKRLFIGSHAGGRIVPTPEPKLAPTPAPPATPATPPPPVAATPAPVAVSPAANVKTTALVPKSFASTAGAAGAIAADGAVTVTGPLMKDTYTLKGVAPGGGRIKGIRLEALADPSLPAQGPGRSDNGNFVLSRFAVSFGPAGGADTPTAVKFAAAKADFEQPSYGIAGAIDDKPETGWAISGGIGKPQAATFDVPADVTIAENSPLTILLDHQHSDGKHAIGKFRISVIQEGAK
jgi:hypothetical protein